MNETHFRIQSPAVESSVVLSAFSEAVETIAHEMISKIRDNGVAFPNAVYAELVRALESVRYEAFQSYDDRSNIIFRLVPVDDARYYVCSDLVPHISNVILHSQNGILGIPYQRDFIPFDLTVRSIVEMKGEIGKRLFGALPTHPDADPAYADPILTAEDRASKVSALLTREAECIQDRQTQAQALEREIERLDKNARNRERRRVASVSDPNTLKARRLATRELTQKLAHEALFKELDLAVNRAKRVLTHERKSFARLEASIAALPEEIKLAEILTKETQATFKVQAKENNLSDRQKSALLAGITAKKNRAIAKLKTKSDSLPDAKKRVTLAEITLTHANRRLVQHIKKYGAPKSHTFSDRANTTVQHLSPHLTWLICALILAPEENLPKIPKRAYISTRPKDPKEPTKPGYKFLAPSLPEPKAIEPSRPLNSEDILMASQLIVEMGPPLLIALMLEEIRRNDKTPILPDLEASSPPPISVTEAWAWSSVLVTLGPTVMFKVLLAEILQKDYRMAERREAAAVRPASTPRVNSELAATV